MPVHDSTLEPVHESDRGTIYRGAAEALYDLMREQGQRPSLVISDVRNGTGGSPKLAGLSASETRTGKPSTPARSPSSSPSA